MRYVISTLAILGFASAAYAAHDLGVPPGKAAAVGIDRNGDGHTNGKDYAPGQSAAEPAAVDINGDGVINAKDYAPGQLPLRSKSK